MQDNKNPKPGIPDPKATAVSQQAVAISKQPTAITDLPNDIDALKKMIISLRSDRQDVAVLGDGEVFIRRHVDGNMKSIAKLVTLSEKEGDFYEIKGYGEIPSKFPIQAIGYNKMNTVATVAVITPDTITNPENGERIPNPSIQLGAKSRAVENVWVKKLAVGFAPTGNLVITSSTLFYNCRVYLTTDLQKKLKENAKIGKYINESMLIELAKDDPEIKKELTKLRLTGMIIAIDEDLALWVDTNEKEVQKCMETYNELKKFAERKAQTMAERNALKKHPALSVVYVNPVGVKPNRFAKVKVVGWCHDLTKEDIEKLAKQAEQGETNMKFNGTDVEFIDIDKVDEVTEEEILASADEEEIPDEDITIVDEKQEPESDKQEAEPDETEVIALLREKILQGASIVGEQKAAELIKKKFGTTIDKILKAPQLEMVLKLINAEADKEAAL